MVIIGAGKAAARAVVGLREFGWEGPVTLIGEEVHPPYDRPPLSKAAIMADEHPEPVLLLDEATMTSLNAQWIRGRKATAIDRAGKTVTLSDGQAIPYAKLLISTGAKPRKLPMPGAERALLLRDHEDCIALRQAFSPGVSVAIIGGGFIGLELASSAVKRGCTVSVIEALPRILARAVPEEIAKVVAARHAEAGVDIITQARIASITADAVLLEDGRRIPADILIAGIGASPAIGLGEAAGLTIDNGIACDEHMRTSDPDIYAAGDCCSFIHPLFDRRRMRLETWRSAQDQAAVATENMCGGGKSYLAVPWFWSDQYDLSLQIAGVPADGPTIVHRPLKDGAFVLCHLRADGTLVGASGIGPGNSVSRDIKMLELLIGKQARIPGDVLANPDTQLRTLLKG